jgi:predicted ABC-type transport system involved in lysophospholipase L1 biosynthesis ATPase subunit
LHAEYNLTLIVVTHSEALAARMDRIVRMVDGCIAS